MAGVAERKKARRGGSAGDMVRSLGLVLSGVVVVFFFAQPPGSDEAQVRVVDPSGDIRAFRAEAPAAAAPASLPAGWRPTVSLLGGPSRGLRIGYNTPANEYAEYAASTAPAAEAVQELTGGGARLAPVDVAGTTWEQYRDADGSLSLVRSYGPVTVVVGTLRSTAALSELQVLARSMTVG